MPDDGPAPSQPIWPLPSFSFQVTWGSQSKIPFQEVSGLDTETQVIEYRHSNAPMYSTIKMPGSQKFGNVTLRRGVFVKDNSFWQWYSQITMNTMARSDVVVQLLDQKGSPTMTWTLRNAWPTKISAPTLQADGNQAAIESLEVAHQGLVISNG